MGVERTIIGLIAILIVSDEIRSENSINVFRDLCPCLPLSVCPRIFGASPEDRKYLGDILKCPDSDYVRCCGVSASVEIGDNSLSKRSSDEGTEIDSMEYGSSFRSHFGLSAVTSESPFLSTTPNLMKYSDHTATESTGYHFVYEKEVFQLEDSNDGIFVKSTEDSPERTEAPKTITSTTSRTTTPSTTPATTTTSTTTTRTTTARTTTAATPVVSSTTEKSALLVYPSEMSGIPKIMPRDFLAGSEMKTFDGTKELHVVFSQPPVTTEKPKEAIPVRREPLKSTTAASPTETTIVSSAGNASTPSATSTISTTITTVNPKTKRNRFMPSKVRGTESVAGSPSTSASSTPITSTTTTTTTVKPAIKKKVRTPAPIVTIERPASRRTPTRTKNSTLATTSPAPTNVTTTTVAPVATTTPAEVRRVLFNPVKRLNFLQKRATIPPPISNAIPSEKSKSDPELPSFDANLKERVDTDHKDMIEKVHVVLRSRSINVVAGPLKGSPGRNAIDPAVTARIDSIERMVEEHMLDVVSAAPINDLVGLKANLMEENPSDNNGESSVSTNSSTTLTTSDGRPRRVRGRGTVRFNTQPASTASTASFKAVTESLHPIGGNRVGRRLRTKGRGANTVHIESTSSAATLPTDATPTTTPATGVTSIAPTISTSTTSRRPDAVRRTSLRAVEITPTEETTTTPTTTTTAVSSSRRPEIISRRTPQRPTKTNEVRKVQATVSPTTDTMKTAASQPAARRTTVTVTTSSSTTAAPNTVANTRAAILVKTTTSAPSSPTVDTTVTTTAATTTNSIPTQQTAASNEVVPVLITDFRPSPLWTFEDVGNVGANVDEEVPARVTLLEPSPLSSRQSRNAFFPPAEVYEGFVPLPNPEIFNIRGL